MLIKDRIILITGHIGGGSNVKALTNVRFHSLHPQTVNIIHNGSASLALEQPAQIGFAHMQAMSDVIQRVYGGIVAVNEGNGLFKCIQGGSLTVVLHCNDPFQVMNTNS